MAAPVFAQSQKGLVSINGNNFNALIVEYEESATLEDITYTTPGGPTGAVKIAGYPSGRGSIEFIYDTANQPTISPFDMRAGTTMAVVVMPEGTKPYSFSAISGRFRFRTGPQANTGGTSVRCTTEYETTGPLSRPVS